MINWKVVNIEYIKDQDGLTNVAKNVHWFCEKKVGDQYGNCWGNEQLDIGDLSSDSFVAFEDLTEEQVLYWVKDSMGSRLAEVETFVNNQVNEGTRSERGIGTPDSWS